MAIDISKLDKIESSTEFETSIGNLYLFSLSLKHSYILSSAFKHSDNESKPLQCIKILIALVFYPEISLKDGKYKPEERVLSLEDVNKLSEEEIKNIAEIYIEYNSSLYKSKKTWIELNDEGKEIHHSKYEGIKYPKEEDESSINYLYRLLCLKDEREQKQMREIMNSIPKLGGFSPELQRAVAENLSTGNALTQAMKSIEPLQQSLKARSIPKEYVINNNMRMHSERIKANKEPFDKLAERLDTLIEASSKSTDILSKGNIQQVEMYSENKSVVDETNELQKKILQETISGGDRSNKKTNVVISLTIVGILTSFGLSFYTGLDKSSSEAESLILLEENKKDLQTLKESNDLYNQEISRLRAKIEQFESTKK